MIKNKIIPIFFATDKNYVPYLTVAIKSLVDKTNLNNKYKIFILSADLTTFDIVEIKSFERKNISIEIVDVSEKIENIKNKVALRDYYSVSIYFRLFIPTMFPQFDKAIYVDSDVIFNRDIADLFGVDIAQNYVGAVLDETVFTNEDFIYYVNEALDVSEKQYFNSGVLIMNLKKFRDNNIEEDFYKWVNDYYFGSVAPDQDYLNCICKNKVKYLDLGWDKMPLGDQLPDEKLFLIHYNMFYKPWKYQGVMYEDYFWNAAKGTTYYEALRKQQKCYSESDKQKDKVGAENLIKMAINIANSDNNYKSVVLKKRKNPQTVETVDFESEEDILEEIISISSPIKLSHKK